ncbi:polymorphic toxin-type HINT domain-containing protein [Maricaulis sp.]|uniref:polymorphic toxin-type HINT domain-containing protein n=1 Tax=Maricaulis sp. TaxID=1486257 RepID=UPI003A94806F
MTDTDTGMVYMQARYYDPAIGRFLLGDPVGFAQGGPGYFNRYAYVGNDPVNGVDPTGEAVETIWDAANVAMGVASLVSNVSQGNFGGAAVDLVGVVIDGAATAVPFVPGGAGTAIKVGRAANAVADAARGADRAADAARRTCCFVAGTLVDTEDGLRPIEEIEAGDRVWSRDAETGETALQPVTDLIRRHERAIWDVELVAADGAHELFETTDDHPWWIAGRGWFATEELVPGSAVVTRDGRGMVIARVEQTDRVDATYNLTVDAFHTYFVGDQRVLVHNCDRLPRPPRGPGSVPRDQRDPQRTFSPSDRAAKREQQGSQCANGCGTEIDASNSQGHHIERHADDGPTTSENHAEVCTDCHRRLHSRDD